MKADLKKEKQKEKRQQKKEAAKIANATDETAEVENSGQQQPLAATTEPTQEKQDGK